MKSLRYYIGCLLVLSLLAGCANQQSEGPTLLDQPEASSQVTEVQTPIVEPQEEYPEPEPLQHGAVLDLDLDNGALSAEFSYSKTHKLGDTFLLGKGFTVAEMFCDGEEVSWTDSVESILLDGYYPVNRYTVPAFEENLTIRYTGSIEGSSRYTTYSRETISQAFTLLRWETFCYPLFGADFDSLLDFLDLDDPLRGAVTIRIPEGYTAATPYAPIEQMTHNGIVSWIFDGDLASLSVAIAEYDPLVLPSGAYYLLPGADLPAMEALISPVMEETAQFLGETFGTVEIPSTMRYITIPEGYGGWAVNGRAVFLPEDTFASEYDTLQLIHEFIHLGWNPRTEISNRPVQRSRFFDEGITCYLQARVSGHLWGEEAYLTEIDHSKQRLQGQSVVRQVPIAEYGAYDYGMLSYNIGPVFFDELAKLVGTEALDAATRVFLEQYRESPVDFDLFADAYTTLLDHPKLENFFSDWLYSTEGIRRVLDT